MKMPHPNDIVDARDWLKSGAPSASKDFNAPNMVSILLDIIKILPSLDKRYSYGSDKWCDAIKEPTKFEEPEESIRDDNNQS
jgi:hypothetical protein